MLFVHGCFWHRHPNCGRTRTPKTNISFWESKFADNVSRDELKRSELEGLGWTVRVIWECETEDPHKLNLLASEIKQIPIFEN